MKGRVRVEFLETHAFLALLDEGAVGQAAQLGRLLSVQTYVSGTAGLRSAVMLTRYALHGPPDASASRTETWKVCKSGRVAGTAGSTAACLARERVLKLLPRSAQRRTVHLPAEENLVRSLDAARNEELSVLTRRVVRCVLPSLPVAHRNALPAPSPRPLP